MNKYKIPVNLNNFVLKRSSVTTYPFTVKDITVHDT